MKKERFLLPLLLIVIWQGLCTIQVVPSYKLPSPVEIVLGFKVLLIVGVPPGNFLHNHILYILPLNLLVKLPNSLFILPSLPQIHLSTHNDRTISTAILSFSLQHINFLFYLNF